jgi:hypothetical protein
MWKRKMGLVVNNRPFKKVFIKRNPVARPKQSVFKFIKNIRGKNVIMKQFSNIYPIVKKTFKEKPPAPVINIPEKKFLCISLKREGNRIPNIILSNIEEYEKYKSFDIIKIPENVLHGDREISKLLNVFNFLYENGGIYLNKKIKTHPDLFIKNHEFVGVDIQLFACEKKSPLLKKIIDEVGEDDRLDTVISSFYSNMENGYKFNKSIHYLI